MSPSRLVPPALPRMVLLGVLLLAGCTQASAPEAGSGAEPEPLRVVSLGGDLTEIVVALGAEDTLIARDATSSFPPSIEALPDVGYVRALNAEGILALSPTLVIASSEAGPPEALEQLRA
ncbi:MAG: ABC transporter substrate-binding protein, partial [Litorimonas sp.]